MPKPTVPVPALTSTEVLEYSTTLLQEQVSLLEHQGTRWHTPDLWRVLLAAAVQRSTIEASCSDWAAGPDANTVRHVLRTGVTNAELAQLEGAFNQALVARLPRWLWHRTLEVALDLHDEPFYGRSEAEAAFICRGEAQKGTTRFYRCATAYVLAAGMRFTLALVFLRKTDRVAAVAQRLHQQVMAAGLRVARWYLDRGFLSVELLQYLQAQRVSAILAVSQGVGRRGIKALCHGPRSYRIQHTFHHPVQGAVTVSLSVVRTYERRHGKRRVRWMVFALLRCRAEPRAVRQMYRRRFGIESGYRLLEQLRARTTSPCSAWHFLFMGLAAVLLTCWNALQWAYLSAQHRGALILGEGPFRLHRFIRFVQQAIDHGYTLNAVLRIHT